jgi:hypothetical protein
VAGAAVSRFLLSWLNSTFLLLSSGEEEAGELKVYLAAMSVENLNGISYGVFDIENVLYGVVHFRIQGVC